MRYLNTSHISVADNVFHGYKTGKGLKLKPRHSESMRNWDSGTSRSQQQADSTRRRENTGREFPLRQRGWNWSRWITVTERSAGAQAPCCRDLAVPRTRTAHVQCLGPPGSSALWNLVEPNVSYTLRIYDTGKCSHINLSEKSRKQNTLLAWSLSFNENIHVHTRKSKG